MQGDSGRTAEALFEGCPAGLAACREVAAAVAALGDHAVRVSKTQVAFHAARRGFAYVWRPDRVGHPVAPAVLSVALPRQVPSARFREVVQLRAGLWMHHLLLTGAADVDAEVRGWLAEAYDAAG
ncbi:DUF5655 domain-containing protein [Puerhibacterium sp. TATVAM-FAB25]|uniref:DUF5655 domain-containing protein n=1 Tax=Puerhibacterium sp. TATVAM-FAB25 TaxID=3093699 RepID=UPI0039793FA4